MADPTPTPPQGALPPKPAEAAKVQPKKETVRINLPPKPTASPTIKIPAPAAVAAATPAPAAPSGAAAAPVAATPVAATAAPRAAVPTTPVSRPMPPSRPPAVSGVDKGLAIFALLVVLALLGRIVTLVPMS